MLTKDVISHFGDISKAARAIGCTRGAIYAWGEHPPRLRQYDIERITGGLLRAELPPIILKNARAVRERDS